MKFIALALAVILLQAKSPQTAQPSAGDFLIMEFTHESGQKISFSVWEAKQLYERVFAETDPSLSTNKWMPPYLKEKLTELRQIYRLHDPRIPPGFDMRKFEPSKGVTMAAANYCDFPTLGLYNKPCVYVYVSIIMLFNRINYAGDPADTTFRRTVAVHLAHEAIHHERGPSFFQGAIPQKALEDEEIRTWFLTISKIARPILESGRTLDPELVAMDRLLQKCRYKLPCPVFENYIRATKVAK